ncbi:MAG: hypothetical protein SF097_00115 [Acidobacteriota bacterium]|nr:hypothetical protein [Acidobacteriota bacterium]
MHYHPTPLVYYREPHRSGENALPMTLISVFGISLTANGLCLVLGLSFFFCLLIAVPVYGFKLYLLLRRQRYEDDQPNNFFAYAILTGVLLLLMPFGLYGFGHTALGVKSETQLSAPNSAEQIQPPQQTAITESSGQKETHSFFGFFSATGRKETFPIVCWIVALIIEGATFILGLLDRRDEYYWE